MSTVVSPAATMESGRRRPQVDQEQTIAGPGLVEPLSEDIKLGSELSGKLKAVYVEESLNRYIVAVLRHTRADQRLYLGASPRAGIALLRVAKARALAEGRSFVSPDDVKTVAQPVLAHRLIVAPEARSSGLSAEDLVREAIEKTPVPV